MASRTARHVVSALALVTVAAALAYFGIPRPARSNGHRRRHSHAVAPVAASTTPVAPLSGATRLRVTFLAVGQGDAALLESPDGHAAMIDTGPPEGTDALRAALAAHAIRRLDWLLLSHPHLDHIGGAQAVLDAIHVARVIDPAYPHPIATYEHLLDRIRGVGIAFARAERGGGLDLGTGVRVEILEPHAPFLQNTRSDVNANSVVARVTTGSIRILFTGDAERETEERILADGSDVRADVLKVAHHGSRYASTAPFLDAVAPRFAVISCGAGNDYGHPHRETLEALAARRITFYRTDLNGDVVFTTDGASVSFAAARQASDGESMTPGARERGAGEPR